MEIVKKPVPNLKVVAPKVPPPQDHVLLGYELVEVNPGGASCCRPPLFWKMNAGGMATSGTLACVGCCFGFPCLGMIPWCLKSSYNMVQVPIYGPPPSEVNRPAPEQPRNEKQEAQPSLV